MKANPNNDVQQEYANDTGITRVSVVETTQTNNAQHQKTSFHDALSGYIEEELLNGERLNWMPLIIEGVNIIIEVEEDDIEKEVGLCEYDVIGRIIFHKWDKPYSITEVKTKFSAIWKITEFGIAHQGEGNYHIFPRNVNFQSLVMCMGTLNLKPSFSIF